ncbi:MAG TPA: sialidase family protein, partial [Candidatus Thermoplasmatota archaeon]|nr:sialidase family protein [Candidatus Thermoplasmatota archaeon]
MSTRRTATLVALVMLIPIALPLVPTAAAAAVGSPTLPTFFNYVAPSTVGNGALEPTLGVNWATGNVMWMQGTRVFRVTFNDNLATPAATWTGVKPLNSIVNADPMLVLNPYTGRTYAGGLDGPCSVMSYSDDDGATWTPTGNMCSGTIDHQTLVEGPWAGGKPAAAIHNMAVYYCAQLSAIACSTSMDGGLTWLPPVAVGGPCFSLHGHLNVSPSGVAYLPVKNCGSGLQGYAWTTNNGL